MLTADVTGGVTAAMTTKTCAGTTRGGITQTGERMMGITDPGPISPTSAVSTLILFFTNLLQLN